MSSLGKKLSHHDLRRFARRGHRRRYGRAARGLCHRYGCAQCLPHAARAGRGAFATARRESDAPLFLSGVKNGVTCGGAVTAVIRNGDAHPATMTLCAIRRARPRGLCRPHERRRCRRSLRRRTLFRTAHRAALRCGRHRHAASGRGKHPHRFAHRLHCRYRGRGHLPASTLGKPFPTLSEARGEEMLAAIARHAPTATASAAWWRCAVLGLPAGLGDALLTAWRAVFPRRSSAFPL